jgi:uncharacterized protein with ParB-like and HNH nuclease domain
LLEENSEESKLKADNISLVRFLGRSDIVFEIPVYQRNYEWGKDQCEQLFADLIRAGKKQSSHFIGTIVYVPESGDDLSHIEIIIDGQQRLMSCMLLLKAIAVSDASVSEEIADKYLTNKYLKLNNHIKLKPVEKDQEAFIAILNNREEGYKKPSKVIENYRVFKELIATSGYSGQELLEALNYLNMVYIELKEENPQIIFESLNSTGLSLSASDLIRNFLLMKLESATQERLYKDYWLKIENLFTTKLFTDFVRHYLIMKTGKLVKNDEVYATYKRFYDDQDFTSEDALIDLHRNATFYSELLNEQSPSMEFNRIIRNINLMEKKVVYPYLLKLLELQTKEEMSWEEINEIAHTLESLLYRRTICGIPSNGLNKIIASLAAKHEGRDEFQNLRKRLRTSNFPNDKEFKRKLLEYPIYKKKRNLARLTLVVLEEYRTKETIDFNQAQIEHIMPRNLSSDWKLEVPNATNVNKQLGNTIGNLTLTKYNQEIGNKVYKLKREQYEKSNVSLTREVAKDYEEWNKDSIQNRADKLADDLLTIFVKPQDFDNSVVDNRGEHLINEGLNVTGMKPVRLTIQDNDIKVKSWASCLVKFLDYIWENDNEAYEKIKCIPSVGAMLFTNMRSPKELANGDMVETNFSANTIVTLLAKISEFCGITEEVSYTIE